MRASLPRAAGPVRAVRIVWIVVALWAAAAERAAAADPGASLRELSTDRPDLTESPYTVDQGHTQIEIEALAYGQDEQPGATIRSVGWVGFLIKRGLSQTVDIQVGVPEVYRHTEHEFEDPERLRWSDDRGPGDLVVRLKWNLLGNDGGDAALALMPFLDLPTAVDGSTTGRPVEGGLILPLALSGPLGAGLGAMVEVDWIDVDRERRLFWIGTATVGHRIAGPVDGFIELAGGFEPGRADDWIGLANAGFTVGLGLNAQLDGGGRLGVTDVAPDWELFLGFSVRR